jgi:hypothetical protein
MASEQISRAATFAGKLIENDYAQEQLRNGALQLQAAVRRASGRKAADAALDKKIYARVGSAATSLREGAAALVAGRQKPKPNWTRRIVLVSAIGGVAAAAANEDLRNRVMGGTTSNDPQPAEAAA